MTKKLTEKDKEYSKEFEVMTITKDDIRGFLEDNDNFEEVKQKMVAMINVDMKRLATKMGDANFNDFNEFLRDYFEWLLKVGWWRLTEKEKMNSMQKSM